MIIVTDTHIFVFGHVGQQTVMTSSIRITKMFSEISFSVSERSLQVPWLQNWRLCTAAVWCVSKSPTQSEGQTAQTPKPAAQLREENLVHTVFHHMCKIYAFQMQLFTGVRILMLEVILLRTVTIPSNVLQLNFNRLEINLNLVHQPK